MQDLSRKLALIGSVLFMGMSISCSTKETSPHRPLVEDKYTLTKDREAFEELRKNIPADVRKENDEKAFMASLMSDYSLSPSEVRNRFSSYVNRKREIFSRDRSKEREAFSKAQAQEREKFIRAQAEQRESFARKKKTSDERRDFFDRIETERRDFYTEQREKRDSFEEEMREKRKDFDDYIRSKTDEFNQLHRDYVKRHEEHRKARLDLQRQADIERNNYLKSIEQEYDSVRKKNPTYLQAPDEE